MKAYRIDNVGKEIEIKFDIARRLVIEGRANVRDIELEKNSIVETEKKLSELKTKQILSNYIPVDFKIMNWKMVNIQ